MFIIGDVHGCFETLTSLLNKIDQNEKIVFVGDLIDRGLESAKVLNLIIEKQFDVVLGNHEFMMYNYFYHQNFSYSWLYQGGEETMFSYENDKDLLKNVKDSKLILKDLKWINTLPIVKEYEFKKYKNLLVSHSMILQHLNNTTLSEINNEKNKDIIVDYIFNREVLTKKGLLLENDKYYNVFGHTIQKNFKPLIKNSFACIDTGSYFNKKDDIYQGKITALHYPTLEYIQQKNIE